jgi:hypothetical protein
MRRVVFSLLTAAGIVAAGAPARALDPRHPDWPCQQVKVPQISAAAVWSGPPIEEIGDRWQQDAKIKELVGRLAARRTPLDEAQKMAAAFVSATGTDKEEKAKLLFAGLFATLNGVRSDVLNGIERFTRRQREFADRIRAETLRLREMHDAPNADQKKVEEFASQVEWDTRIFEDRRRTIEYVCEVPRILERRLFALGRAIQQALE